MNFEINHLYHIYNQGNNRQRIFFKRENYLFFLKKSQTCFLPYSDILAWCLMPNHFHFLVYVKLLEVPIDRLGFTQSEAETHNEAETHETQAPRSLNDSIGVLLRSYKRAINKQENRSGSLFRNPTKAECVTKSDGITPSYFDTSKGTRIFTKPTEKEYPQVCWNYIHNNPVKARMVERPEDWEFSSFRDFCGLRNGKLINKNRANEFLTGIKASPDEDVFTK
jgi:putative transposase